MNENAWRAYAGEGTMVTIRWFTSYRLGPDATEEERLDELRRCLREYTLDPRLEPFASDAPHPLVFFGNFVDYSASFHLNVADDAPWTVKEEWFALIHENMKRPEYAQAKRDQAANDKWWRRHQTHEALKRGNPR